MILFLLAVSVIYFLFTLLLWLTWLRIPAVNPPQNGSAGPLVTVIIPVRNEADNIGALLTDLDRQTYRNFEVIVADDSSTDQTGAVVQQHIRQASFPLRLLALSDERTASPKKRAITQSIAIAQGHLILTTDGDCRVGTDWLSAFATFYQKPELKLISGPVTFTTNQSVFDSLQTVEFSSLIGSGACTMALGWPTMCNGANLCYEKAAFAEVGGFAGVDQLASGDDEFLMHKMAVRYPGEVGFLKSEKAVVRTQPHRSWKAFYNQRKRWASKWRMYQSWAPTVLAVFIFLSNMAPLLAVVGWLLGFLNGTVTLSVVVLKVLPEFLFLRQVLVFLQKKSSVAAIPLTQLFYPVYVVFFGLVAQGKGYRWKGRDLN